MAAKKSPRPAAPTGSPKKSHTLESKANAKRAAVKAAQRKKTLKVVAAAKPKPANMRKAKEVVAPPTGVRTSKADGIKIALPTGVKIEAPTKRSGAAPTKRDPYALPDMPELPSLDSLTLPTMQIIDPIEEAASEVLVFGPDLTESPIDDDLDDAEMTHEQRENERMAQLHAGFRARAKQEEQRRALATDTEYWFCVVFQDRDQKEQFLSGIDASDLGDKYIDGTRLAARMGIHVDKSEIVYNIGGADPKLAVLVDLDPDYGKATKTSRPRSRKTP